MEKVISIIGLYFVMSSCPFTGSDTGKQELNNSTQSSAATPVDLPDLPFGVAAPMVPIAKGVYTPLYGRDSVRANIRDFYMDVYPVSNMHYLAFVKKNDRWRKSGVKKIFADDNYLLKWKNDTTLGQLINPNGPVTHVSWFAAKAFCECQGNRLPTVDEWEYVAMADQEVADARMIASYNQDILDWYEKPKTFSNSIGKTFKNYWRIYDLHGLVWEWTSDFNSVLLTGESRNDMTTDNNLFCGSGSLKANDLMNYAAFMRYAFRGSIKANYAIQNLGFRCVKDSL